MSKKNRYYTSYNKDVSNEQENSENINENVVDNTVESNEETEDMLVDRQEVENVIKENVEEVIEKNSEELKSKIEAIHESLVPQEKQEKKEFIVDIKDYVSSTLLSYYESMNSSKIVSNEEAARWNYSLFNLFMEVLNKPLEEFKKDWKTILKFFDQYKNDCFNHGRLYRAPFNWPGTDKEFEIYRTLGFICVETSNPETRSKAVKEMSGLENKLSILSEDHKSKIISFYF